MAFKALADFAWEKDQAVENFKVSEEFHDAKIVCNQEASNMGHKIGYKDCNHWVAARLPKADLSFLDEDEGEEEAKGEPILPESMVIEGLSGSERVVVEVSSLPTIDISISEMTPSTEASSGPSEAAPSSPDFQDEVRRWDALYLYFSFFFVSVKKFSSMKWNFTPF